MALTGGADSWDGHFFLLYATERERRCGLSAWVLRGLELGERVVWTERPDESPDRSLLSVLDQDGVDVAAAQADGRLVLLPLPEFYPPGGQGPIIDRALADGFPGVRIGAETNAALTMMSDPAYVEVERVVDDLCRTRPMSAMCQYERGLTTWSSPGPGDRDPPPGLRDGQVQIHGLADVLALAGEFDMSNHDVLSAALRAAVGRVSVALDVDLGRVTFLDRGSCRVLVEATEPFRAAGGIVRLTGVPPSVEETLRMLAVDRVLRVELVGTQR